MYLIGRSSSGGGVAAGFYRVVFHCKTQMKIDSRKSSDNKRKLWRCACHSRQIGIHAPSSLAQLTTATTQGVIMIPANVLVALFTVAYISNNFHKFPIKE